MVVGTLLRQVSCTCFGPGGLTPAVEGKRNTGQWDSTQDSFIPRPWTQDIEGASVKELCKNSSYKARFLVPGKMPWER